jgi:hypothetical protein
MIFCGQWLLNFASLFSTTGSFGSFFFLPRFAGAAFWDWVGAGVRDEGPGSPYTNGGGAMTDGSTFFVAAFPLLFLAVCLTGSGSGSESKASSTQPIGKARLARLVVGFGSSGSLSRFGWEEDPACPVLTVTHSFPRLRLRTIYSDCRGKDKLQLEMVVVLAN